MKECGIAQVTEVDKIGESYAHLLRAAGVDGIHELSKCKPEELIATLKEVNERTELTQRLPSLKVARGWVRQARVLDPLTNAYKELRERLSDVGDVMKLDEWQELLLEFKPPVKDEMKFIVKQTLMVIVDFYVHLTMKKTRRAVNPVQSLRLLYQRIEDDMDHLSFHSEMLKILKSLGDIHTAYRLPPPYRYSVAFLPLLIKKCYRRKQVDGKEVVQRRYVVTTTLWTPSADLPLTRGDEIISWNGVPMQQAIASHANIVEGSNPSATVEFALQSMTMRWLGATFPPESPWVIITYRDHKRRVKEIRLFWRILVLKEDPKYITSDQYSWYMFNPAQHGEELPHDGAVNPNSHIAHVATRKIFVPQKHQSDEALEKCRKKQKEFREMVHGGGRKKQFLKLLGDIKNTEGRFGPVQPLESQMPRSLEAWILTLGGKQFGHIRIRSFPFSKGPARETDFVTAFRSLLAQMPHYGLILDVRGNPGGSTKNAEMLMQLLCPREIQPLPFQFLSSRLTKKVTSDPKNEAYFGKWASSINIAQKTGSVYSKGSYITDPDDANYWGQEYFGPVVLITSATTYSAADFISASFDDHEIGNIIGVDRTTGGGGANVWFYREHLTQFLPKQTKSRDVDETWPQNINLQFAARRSLRIGKNTGIPIEELGVETDPKLRYHMTKRDLLDNSRDLRCFAIELLSEQRNHDLFVDIETQGEDVNVSIMSLNIDWLELYIDGRVFESHSIKRKRGKHQHEQTEIILPGRAGKDFLLEIHGVENTDEGDEKVARFKHRMIGQGDVKPEE